jgi:hypothetical protein
MFSQHRGTQLCASGTVLCVTAIYIFEWVVYHFVCTPGVTGAIIFNVVFWLALWSYLRTALTNPGTPQSPEWQRWKETRRAQGAPVPVASASGDPRRRSRAWAPGEVQWCDMCELERPERAHHCTTCGVCILRMDHHCPWVGTCVGWRNHKYFLLMSWWSCCACLVFLVTLRRPNTIGSLIILGPMGSGTNPLPPVAVIMALVFFTLTSGMSVYVFNMAVRNTTVVEELFKGQNPYMYDSSMDNLRQLIGSLFPLGLLPVPVEDRPSGASFPLPERDEDSKPEEPLADADGGIDSEESAMEGQLKPLCGAEDPTVDGSYGSYGSV